MKISDFRRHAHEMVDWMADHLESIEDLPVRSQVQPGETLAQLPDAPPERGESMDAIAEDFRRIVLPGMTHWQHPRFFAYFPANSSPPSVLAEMATAALGAQCMLWQTSPAATELEQRMMEWLRDLLALPGDFQGSIQDSASTATLVALLTARERATGWAGNEEGLPAQGRLTVYASEEAHSSIEKGVKIAGFGASNLRQIPTDDGFALDPAALAEAIRADRAAGAVPAAVVACLGTTGVGACDPLAEIARVCRGEDVFLHVDAAWAGSALVLPEQRHWAAGLEDADSFVFNAHKWLFTNFDCTAYYVRDPEALQRTLTILPAYLASRETGAVPEYRDWSIPLGRRFRALKLWFVLRSYGAEGLRGALREHIALAEEMAGWIEAEDDFELVTGPNLSLLTFRYMPTSLRSEPGAPGPEIDELNERLLHELNDDGRIYLTQTKVRGRTVLRVSIGQTRTERRHVEEAWGVIREMARGL
ncbi:MAG: aminotransferase class V-fold PLP-dependent enzyme [Acidobacteriota bacterium]